MALLGGILTASLCYSGAFEQGMKIHKLLPGQLTMHFVLPFSALICHARAMVKIGNLDPTASPLHVCVCNLAYMEIMILVTLNISRFSLNSFH